MTVSAQSSAPSTSSSSSPSSARSRAQSTSSADALAAAPRERGALERLAARPERPPLGFDELRRQGFAAVQRGDLHEALLCYEQSRDLAERGGDRDQLDLATCNIAVVHVELWETAEQEIDRDLEALRSILARLHSPENGWLASHHLARIYERRKNFKRGLFYGRMALDRAGWVDRPLWTGYSHNLLGNLLIAESWVDEAADRYRDALEILTREGDDVWVSRVLDNLGYTRALQGDLDQALELLERSAVGLGRFEAERYTLSNHLALAFVHLLREDPAAARRHAERARELAQRYHDADGLKNSLYLLGQCLQQLGEEREAGEVFSRLQQRFYPDQPALGDQLLQIDTLELVNLRA